MSYTAGLQVISVDLRRFSAAVGWGMNEALIGEEVTLESAPGERLTRLVLSAATAFFEAATGAMGPPEAFVVEVRAALSGMRPSDESVRVRVVVEREGISVHVERGGESPALRVSCTA